MPSHGHHCDLLYDTFKAALFIGVRTSLEFWEWEHRQVNTNGRCPHSLGCLLVRTSRCISKTSKYVMTRRI
jgi:hypothetical protein